ncbi:hypothetical protein F2Q69_00005821 [Brassica cretica]|uniref:Uncharacterized protein n=1 Tax=Brassica cretica TaxID=69181 RepID=A0A8S9NYR3_BRACR|nr:hypothetical protein F2Q69_00005821 [Brassica cretica]
MIWLRYMGASVEEQTRVHGFGSYPVDRCPRQFGHYVETWSALDRSLLVRYVATDSFAGWSLRSDRLSGLVGRYVATDRMAWSVAT